MTLSAKRQVVLPAELCQQLALAPGAQVEVHLGPDGASIVIEPAQMGDKKPASVLFGKVTHRGKPVAVDEMDAAVVAAESVGQEARAGES